MEENPWIKFGELYDKILNAGFSTRIHTLNPNSDEPVHYVWLRTDVLSEWDTYAQDPDLYAALEKAAKMAGVQV